VRVTLVRHGRAAAGWDADVDPGLDDLGRSQARAMAERLAPSGPTTLVTSPLRRCRETALPLAAAWSVEPTVDDAVREIPSPEGLTMAERVPWLRDAMAGTWGALGPRFTAYRDAVVARVAACRADTVIVSHFVAINAVIGSCVGDDRLVIASLDNCSCTVVEIAAGGGLRLVETGHEADTLIR
jgi:broad specificity phosphatase PhoE